MIRDMRRPHFALGAIAMAAALAAGLGCGKKESLVIIKLTTATPTSNPGPVTITVGPVERTFTVPSLSATPAEVGVYVPESVTGEVAIAATVGTRNCAGYDGATTADIKAPGDSVGASITLLPSLRCTCREFEHNDSSLPPCNLNVVPSVSSTYISGAAFSPDGRYFVTVGDDGRAKIWRVDGTTLTMETVIQLASNGRVAFSPDGRSMALVSWTGRGSPIPIYDVPAWTLRRTLTGAVDITIDVAFTPDSQHLVVLESDNYGGGAIDSFSLVSGNMGSASLGGLNPIALAVSPLTGAGIPVAVAAADGRGGLFNYAQDGFTGPTTFALTGNTWIVWTVAFSPDGNLIAAGAEDGTFNFWRLPLTSTAPTGAPLVVGSAGGVNQVAFSSDSEFVAVAAGTIDREVSFWNIGSRSKLASWQPSYLPTTIAYSPDGILVAGGELYCGKVFVCSPE